MTLEAQTKAESNFSFANGCFCSRSRFCLILRVCQITQKTTAAVRGMGQQTLHFQEHVINVEPGRCLRTLPSAWINVDADLSSKVRCDRQSPECSNCVKSGVACGFSGKAKRVNHTKKL